MDLQGLSGVALMLSKHLMSTRKAKNSNVVFSPLSIQVLLNLIATGSNGLTLNQFLLFLKSKSKDQLCSLSSDLVSSVLFDGTSTGGPRLNFANSVWVDKSFSLKPSFKQVVENVYRAASKKFDSEKEAEKVTSEVNSWAEKETNGLVKDILPPGFVKDTTKLILANALYFKGVWNKKFDSSNTKDYKFHLLNGSSVDVPFMTSNEKQYIREYGDFKVLRLPYKQGKDKRCFSMYIFLPDEKDGLPALIEKLDSESGLLDRHVKYRLQKVGKFLIPKFKVSFGFEASELLKNLGLKLPFSEAEADLTEMINMMDSSNHLTTPNLYVSSIIHKSVIEVNEEGTEAAAVSVASVIMLTSVGYRDRKIDFVADHPFLFVIREDITGAMLFIGQLLNPLMD